MCNNPLWNCLWPDTMFKHSHLFYIKSKSRGEVNRNKLDPGTPARRRSGRSNLYLVWAIGLSWLSNTTKISSVLFTVDRNRSDTPRGINFQNSPASSNFKCANYSIVLWAPVKVLSFDIRKNLNSSNDHDSEL